LGFRVLTMNQRIDERRRHPRAQIQVQAELRFTDNSTPLRGQTSDLSLGGCFVETLFTQPVGSRLVVALWIKGRKIVAESVIVSCTPQFGIGIEFHAMPLNDQAVLSEFMRSFEKTEDENEKKTIASLANCQLHTRQR
jgi:hypothetical protein